MLPTPYGEDKKNCSGCYVVALAPVWFVVFNTKDDDFEIGVSGNAEVYAIAFHTQGNTKDPGEYLEVHARDKNNQECQIKYYTNGIDGFFGIVSPVPVTRIFFNESANNDDIALDDLSSGYKE